MVRNLIYIAFVLSASLISCVSSTQKVNEQPYVLLISFDGFRHDYVEKFDAPNFKNFIKNGVAAQGLIPSFPSKTFPNHYSIVTGLYPGNHGLVDNSFYARDLNLSYGIRDREVVVDARFYGGTPLWQLAQENGMKSASYFWVGSEAPIKGRFPDYYHVFDGSVANESRIEAVMDWLKLPVEQRPQFMTLYFSLVDSQGHRSGPNSTETGEAVIEADRLLGLITSKLEQIDLPVNVIIVSDHGMHEILPKKENYMSYDELQDGLDPSDYKFVSNGAHAHFYVHEESEINNIFDQLKNREKGYQTFLREDFPKKWHYGASPERTGDIIVTMDSGHYLGSQRRIDVNISREAIRGEHGFDPYQMEDMQGIFYAKGPQIKEGLQISAFENVHIYPFIAHLLGIEKIPQIDGELKVLQSVIR